MLAASVLHSNICCLCVLSSAKSTERCSTAAKCLNKFYNNIRYPLLWLVPNFPDKEKTLSKSSRSHRFTKFRVCLLHTEFRTSNNQIVVYTLAIRSLFASFFQARNVLFQKLFGFSPIPVYFSGNSCAAAAFFSSCYCILPKNLRLFTTPMVDFKRSSLCSAPNDASSICFACSSLPATLKSYAHEYASHFLLVRHFCSIL